MKHVIHRQRPGRRDRRRDACASMTLPATIILIGDEPEPPYSRMAIPYLLMGDIGEDGTYLRKDKDHFATHEHHAAARAAAKRVDTRKRARRARLTARRSPYDRLLIATGSTSGAAAHSRVSICRACIPAGRWPTRARSCGWPSPAHASCRWVPASSAASSWKRWPAAACSSPWWKWAIAWCRA